MISGRGLFGWHNPDKEAIENVNTYQKQLMIPNNQICVLCNKPHFCLGYFGQTDHLFSAFKDDSVSIVLYGQVYQANDSSVKTTQSSAEIVAKVYQERGESELLKLEGVFCCALFDLRKEKSILFRDDSGFKFLYYYKDLSGVVYFSSEISVLFEISGLEKIISRKALHEYLRTMMIYSPKTIYRNINSVDPGCILFQNKNGEQQKIYPPNPEHIDTSQFSFKDSVDRFNRLLTKSIEKRLELSDRPAFFLSGGMDSSLLCCIGNTIAGSDLDAFTIGIEDGKFDETSRASHLADYLKINHHKLIIKPENYIDYFDMMVRNMDQPFADPSGIPTFYAFDLLKNHTDSIIDGTGSDSLIGSMPPRYKRVAIEYISLFPKPIRDTLKTVFQSLPYLNNYYEIFDFEDPLDLLIMWKSWRVSHIQEICSEPIDFNNNILYQIHKKYHRSQHFERYSEMYRYASDDRIHQSGRLFDVHVNFPFWDPAVQNFVDSLPKEYRYQPGQVKKLIRSALEKHVPKDLLKVKRQGFIFPIEDIMRKNNAELISAYINKGAFQKHGLFDYDFILPFVNRFLNGDDSVKFKIWNIIVFQAWYDLHF